VFTGFWLGGPSGGDLDVSGKITLRWILGKQGSMG
jgi:hypothetical protein